MKRATLRTSSLILLFSFFIFPLTLTATKGSIPRLLIKDPVQNRYRPLRIHDLKIEIRVFGNLAVTSMDITFYNDLSRRLEGEFVFPLPSGSRVSGFSLEVNGRLRKGVVVSKDKGRKVFEKIVRDMIDPGLLELTRGNNFRARVYPVPPKGYKRLVIEWQQELEWKEKGFLYKLPLVFENKIANVKISAEVFKQKARPELGIRENGIRDIFFKKWQENYSARIKKQNWKPAATLAFLLPRTKAYSTQLVERDPLAGDDAFYLHMLPEIRKTPKENYKRVLLVWDASASMQGRDTGKEVALLNRFFAANPQARVKVLVLRNTVEEFSPGFVSWKAISGKIAGIPLDGATSFATLDLDKYGADVVIFSSDGLDTFGAGKMRQKNIPVYPLVSSIKSDYDSLRHLASTTGGTLVDVNRLSGATALRLLTRKVFSLLKVEIVSGGVSGIVPAGISPIHHDFSLVGSLATESAVLKLSFGIPGRVYYTRTITLKNKKVDTGKLVPRIRAQKQIDEILPDYQRTRDRIHALARKYTIVTRDTSLIVLERVEDYVKHRIDPPAELQAAYRVALAQIHARKKKLGITQMDRMVRLFRGLQQWWEKTWPLNTPILKTALKKTRNGSRVGRSASSACERHSQQNGRERPGRPAQRSNGGTDSKKKGASKPPSSGIVLKPWNPKAPYLTILRPLANNERYLSYLRIRRQYGNSSAFFLDVADLFFKKGQKALALRILSNIAEMKLENPQLLRILGHRLDQLGFLSLSADIFTRVKGMRPEEPQSYRDLALVLEKQGKRQQAAELLYKVAITPWDSRFPEIGLIALNELNGILGRYPKIKRDAFDSRLVRSLPVDLRVILTWDADNCDMDLWVTDPNKEKCYYAHRLTYQGGRMSRDFTQGYGPEEFLLKRAKDGVYEIQVNYYGNSQQIIAGATTIQLKLFLNFGRSNQTVKEVTLRLKDKKEVISVGEFRIRFGHK